MNIEIQHPEHEFLLEEGFEQKEPYDNHLEFWVGYETPILKKEKGKFNLKVVYFLKEGIRGKIEVYYDIVANYTELRIWSGLGEDSYWYLIEDIDVNTLRNLILLLKK